MKTEGKRQKEHGRRTEKTVGRDLLPCRLRRGFTFVELVISMALVTLVMGAVVGITFAVADAWKAGETSRSLQVSTHQAATQLSRLLRGANCVGLATADDQAVVTSGSVTSAPGRGAMVMFWTAAGADAQIQVCEVTLIEHDRSDNKLKMYRIPATAANAVTRFRTPDMSTTAAADAFKRLPFVTVRPIATGVSEASFRAYWMNDAYRRQSVEFLLKFSRDHQGRTEYGTACARGPMKPDDT